jgi:Threonyl-tRNA synthetase
MILVIGKQEQENKSVAVRYLGSKKQEFLSLNEFLENIIKTCAPPDVIN